MTRFCPICGEHNKDAALRCQCGRVFAEDIKDAHAVQWVDPRQYRRRLRIKKVGALLGAVGMVLLFAAYFGGVFSMPGKAVEKDEPHLVAAAEPQVVEPPSAPKPSVFPEANVLYRASRAITGSVIGVSDANGQERRVTLIGIRVPKLNESFGIESKENLWTLIANKPIQIKPRKFTKEVETIAEVIVDGTNVGIEQIQAGFAFFAVEELSGRPVSELQQYLAAARAAKNGKFGIWSGKLPALAQSTPAIDNGTRASDPVESKGSGQRRQPTGTSFDPEYVYEPPPNDAPLVSEQPKVKEQAPATGPPAKETPAPEIRKPVATPPSTGRKYTRGPFGGCFYLNSSGNKTYVDRSKCDGM